MDTNQFKFYVGNDPEMDEPIQVKIDRQAMKIYYRSPSDETWIEEKLDADESLDGFNPNHNELMG